MPRLIDQEPAAGSAHVVQDETAPLTQRAVLNFEGAGVTVTDDAGNDATVVTIPGGSGTSYASRVFARRSFR